MTDPYGVLGVSPSANDNDIKKAYRDLARKYHPDNYADNPLADLAQEKMKEINEAYDEIQRMRGTGGSSSGGGSYSGSSSYTRSGGANADSARIRNAINSGNITLAEELLRSYQPHDAEWHFLMGSLNYRRGWLDDAVSSFQTAVSMNPGNVEYRQALNRMNYQGPAYNPYGGGGMQNAGGCSACDICTAMMCANMCCQC